MTDEPARARDVPATADAAIAAIAATAKQTRQPTPRWAWTLAIVLGIGGVIAFTIMMVAPSDHSGPVADAAAAKTELGFGAGLILGLVAGIGIGIAIARRRT